MSGVDERLLYDFNDEARKGITLAMHAINGVLNEEVVEETYTTAAEEGEEESGNVKNVADINITYDTGKCFPQNKG